MTVTPVTVREGRGHSASLSNQSLDLPGNWESLTEVRDTSKFLLPAGTSFVERDVLGVAEEVNRMTNGTCRIASCECGRCLEKGHFPHVVIEQGKSGRMYPIFGCREIGPHIIQRLREIHVQNKPNQKAMEKNKKIYAARKQVARDQQTEALEVIRSALESKKQDWRGPNGLRTEALRTRL